jgi:hypothetical protein
VSELVEEVERLDVLLELYAHSRCD